MTGTRAGVQLDPDGQPPFYFEDLAIMQDGRVQAFGQCPECHSEASVQHSTIDPISSKLYLLFQCSICDWERLGSISDPRQDPFLMTKPKPPAKPPVTAAVAGFVGGAAMGAAWILIIWMVLKGVGWW